MPLYRQLSVADMLHLTRNLNPASTTPTPGRGSRDLGIAEKHKAGKLSGGQRAQLALTLALAGTRGSWSSTSRPRRSIRWPGTTSWPR